MFNAECQSIIYTDYKPYVEFLNIEYYEDIFIYWANKLRLINICIQYILDEKNIYSSTNVRHLSW